MELLGGVISVSGVSYLIFSIMAIVALGYLLGRITIKGISLGTAGVFVISLLYGAFFLRQACICNENSGNCITRS